jgi:hypothetical protein
MLLNFSSLIPQIDGVLTHLGDEMRRVPGLVLTEGDFHCRLYARLSAIAEFEEPRPTLDPDVLAPSVHSEVSWYDEAGRLLIRPDITILEPEHLNLLHGYLPPIPAGSEPELETMAWPPLPNKGFEFGGRAVVFEVKFARNGLDRVTTSKVLEDWDQARRLLRLLAARGEAGSTFVYIVLANKFAQNLTRGPLYELMREYGESSQHKFVYIPGSLRRGQLKTRRRCLPSVSLKRLALENQPFRRRLPTDDD